MNGSNPSQATTNQKFSEMLRLINASRTVRGWAHLTEDEAKRVVPIWVGYLDSARVPLEHFGRLFERASETRANAIANGERPPDLSPELLVAQWRGRNGLAAELEHRRTETVGSGIVEMIAGDGSKMLWRDECPDCFGTGYRRVMQGGYSGVVH